MPKKHHDPEFYAKPYTAERGSLFENKTEDAAPKDMVKESKPQLTEKYGETAKRRERAEKLEADSL